MNQKSITITLEFTLDIKKSLVLSLQTIKLNCVPQEFGAGGGANG